MQQKSNTLEFSFAKKKPEIEFRIKAMVLGKATKEINIFHDLQKCSNKVFTEEEKHMRNVTTEEDHHEMYVRSVFTKKIISF